VFINNKYWKKNNKKNKNTHIIQVRNKTIKLNNVMNHTYTHSNNNNNNNNNKKKNKIYKEIRKST
jgi:hypothetical protein